LDSFEITVSAKAKGQMPKLTGDSAPALGGGNRRGGSGGGSGKARELEA
jgi:hypothetical protein